MIYSTLYNKSTNEDPKTSLVFENLMLFPDNVFWQILKNSAANKNILPEEAGLLSDEVYFWPKWDSKSQYDTGNSIYVEPDVFFRFANIDVIVEAKYSDSTGQFREEWEREFKAYLNEYGEDKKRVVLLAVGGNSSLILESELEVGTRKCPIVKYSWTSILHAVLEYENDNLSNIQTYLQSSMKRLVRNIEIGFNNFGIYKYKKKVEIKGLSNLFVLGQLFKEAINHKTDKYSLSLRKDDMKEAHYGYLFKVAPNDERKESIWLSIALWINNKELISIGARNEESWAKALCKEFEDEKGNRFASNYAKEPYCEENIYYFDATDKLYDEFRDSETFDSQVEIIRKYIDEVCLYYIN